MERIDQNEESEKPKDVDKIEIEVEKDKKKENEEVKEKEKETKEEKVDEEKEKDDKKEDDKKKEDKKNDKKKEKKEKKSKKDKEKEREKKKEEEYKKNIIFSIDEENKVCVDCDKLNPTKVSINNGVLICEECAKKHEELGHSVSYVRDIDESFDEYLLNFIVLGSNTKFKRFLIEENVDPSMPVDKKYMTRACVFYRRNLKKKVEGEKLLEKDYDDPNEIVALVNDDYPEFTKYKMKKQVVSHGELKKRAASPKLQKLGGGIFSLGKKMFGGVKKGATLVGPAAGALKKGAGVVGKKMTFAYQAIKKNIGKRNEIAKVEEGENEGDIDLNKSVPPPVINKKGDSIIAESGRAFNNDGEGEGEKEPEGEVEGNTPVTPDNQDKKVEDKKEDEKHEEEKEDEEKID